MAQPSRGLKSNYARNRILNIFHPDPYVNIHIMPRQVLLKEPEHMAHIISDCMHATGLLTRISNKDPLRFLSEDVGSRDVKVMGLKPFHFRGYLVTNLINWSRGFTTSPLVHSLQMFGPGVTAMYHRNKFQYCHEMLNAACEVHEAMGRPIRKEVRDVWRLSARSGEWNQALSSAIDHRMNTLMERSMDYSSRLPNWARESGGVPNTGFIGSNEIIKRWYLLWWKLVRVNKISSRDLKEWVADYVNGWDLYNEAIHMTPERNAGDFFTDIAATARIQHRLAPEVPPIRKLLIDTTKVFRGSDIQRVDLEVISSVVDSKVFDTLVSANREIWQEQRDNEQMRFRDRFRFSL